jgi:cytochrome c
MTRHRLGATLFLVLGFALLHQATAAGAAQGKALFERRCAGCHSLDADKEGPRLRGVYGRRAGSVSSFNYSDGLKRMQMTWDADSLDRWLADPDKLVPDNDMAFRLINADERREVIEFLKQLSAK